MTTQEIMAQAHAIGFRACKEFGNEWVRLVAYKPRRQSEGMMTIFAEITLQHRDESGNWGALPVGQMLTDHANWHRRHYSSTRKPWELGGLPQEIAGRAKQNKR